MRNIDYNIWVEEYVNSKFETILDESISEKNSSVDKTLEDLVITSKFDVIGETSVFESSVTSLSNKDKYLTLSLNLNIDNWSKDNYLLVPAAVYNGNRFKVKKMEYPPIFNEKDEQVLDNEVTITDVPHFSKENGESEIRLRAGDSSTPAVCIYFKEEQEGIIVIYPQGISQCENGVILTENNDKTKLNIKVMAPVIRENGAYSFYGITSKAQCNDKPAKLKSNQNLELSATIYSFKCSSVQELYDRFFDIAYNAKKDISLVENMMPFSQAFKYIEDKYNIDNWRENHEYYGVGLRETNCLNGCWQTGWVGGINDLPAFLSHGSDLTKERAIKTLDFIFDKVQVEQGLFYGIGDGDTWNGDNFLDKSDASQLLVRKAADALYFGAVTLHVLKKENIEIKETWSKGVTKCADVFCEVFNKYNQLGQFINIFTNEIIVGSSASGAMAVGGLALMYLLNNDSKYIECSKKLANYYYDNFVKLGITNGGPGEILSAPDSESSYALLESFVTLYEVSKDKLYLNYAKDMAKQFATWCMTYDYEFPKTSEFHRIKAKTTGSVWANVQNKHSAPGICTHSGSGLFRLYLYTNDERYLNLIRAIDHNITQYLSTESRRLYDYWNNPRPLGHMSERVSTSDWEGFGMIGGAAGSVWCEISALLSYMDIPGVYIDLENKKVVPIDHVEVKLVEEDENIELEVFNPTVYDSTVKLFIGNKGMNFNNYFEYLDLFKSVDIKAKQTVKINLNNYI